MTKNLQTQELTELNLNELFQNHWKEVYSFAKAKTRDLHKAKDLTSETFIKAFLQIENYNPELKFKNWIITICRNTFIDDCRRNNNKVTYLEDYLFFEINDTAPSPEKRMIIKEQYYQTLTAINQLEENDEEIITLFYLADLSYKRISANLNISYSNARTRLNRAKHRLRDQLN